MLTPKSTSLFRLCVPLLLVVCVAQIVTAEQDNGDSQLQQQLLQPQISEIESPPENNMPVPVSMSGAVPIPYQSQARQFYYPNQQYIPPYGQFPQYQQQYPNFGQFQYPQYQIPNQGFGNPQQGFFRPFPTAATTATVAPATTAATTTTTTTTTPRPLQVGVSTLFPLVGAGSGFGRPGSQNVLNGQQAAFPNGIPFNYFQG